MRFKTVRRPWPQWRKFPFRAPMLRQDTESFPSGEAIFRKNPPSSPRTWPPARPANRSCFPRRTAAIDIRFSIVPTAAPATPSSAPCPMTGKTRSWTVFPCAPHAAQNTAISATGATTPSRTAAANAGPRLFSWMRKETMCAKAMLRTIPSSWPSISLPGAGFWR